MKRNATPRQRLRRSVLLVALGCGLGACASQEPPAAAVTATAAPAATAAPIPSSRSFNSAAASTAAGSPSAKPLAGPDVPPGASVVRTIDVPGDGEVIYEHGILWVEDRQDRALSQIDPSTGTTIRTVPDVLGGFMTYRGGIVWMSSYVLDRLLRIDPGTGQVTQIDTGKGEAGTEAVVGTARGVWVANHRLGTVVLYDDAGKPVQSVTVSPPDIQGPQSMVADGTYVWVGVPDLYELVGVRIADGKVVHRVKLRWWPSGAPCAGEARVWVTSAGDGLTTEVDSRSGTVNRVLDVGATTGRCEFAFGSLWFPTLEPGGLVRVDPGSGRVTGRLALPAAALDLAASEGRLWIRLEGALLEVKPD